MEYEINKIKYGKNKTMYVPVFNDPSMKIMEEFLAVEVKNFGKEIMEILEKGEDTEFAGNVCALKIKDGVVRIESTLDGADLGEPAQMSFQYFAQVVSEWIEEKKNENK